MTEETLPRQRGDFRLLEVLGQNDASTLYRATNERRGASERDGVLRAVDARLLTQGASLVRPWIEQTRRRCKVMSPHLVGVHEIGVDEEGAFVMASLVEGVSLQRMLSAARQQGERLPWPVVGRILLDVLAGWGALDSVHGGEGRRLERCLGQLRAGRVMVGLDGIARLGDASDAVLAGLELHAEPWSEVATSWRQAPGDVWAVGLLGWEALAGRSFFPGTSARGALRWMAWRGAEMSAVGDLRPELPYIVQAVFDQALKRGTDARWPTVASMSDALTAALGATCGPVNRSLVSQCVQGCLWQEERERASQQASQLPSLDDEVRSYRDNALPGPGSARVVRSRAPGEASASFWRRLWARLRG